MIPVTPLSRVYYEVPLGFHFEKQTTGINQKIYNIGKSVLEYLRINQKAISIAIWSYVCINIGEAISQASLEKVPRLQSCEDTLCEYWNDYNRTDNNLTRTIDIRCNIFNPNYYPFTLFEKCMQTLCKYIDDNGKSLFGCAKYLDQLNPSLEWNNISSLPLQLWNQFCPKGLYNIINLSNQKNYFSKCLQDLCDYYFYSPELQNKLIERTCLGLQVKPLTEKLEELEKKIEDKSTSVHSTLSMLESTSAIANNIIAIGSILVGLYVSTKVALVAKEKLFPNIKDGLSSIIKGSAQTSSAVANIAPTSEAMEEIREVISDLLDDVNDIFSNAETYLSEESGNSVYQSAREFQSKVNLPDLPLTGKVKPVLLALGGGALAGAGGVKIVEAAVRKNLEEGGNNAVTKAIPSVTSVAEFVTNATLNLTSLMKNTKVIPSVTSVVKSVTNATLNLTSLMKNTLDTGLDKNTMQNEDLLQDQIFFDSKKYPKISEDPLETTPDEYADFLLDPYYYDNIIDTQAARIENSLEYWHNSPCLYETPNYLYCRPNLYNNLTTIPLLVLRTMIVGYDYLCHYFQEIGVWCDWNQFFNLAAMKLYSTRNITLTGACPFDHISLNIEKYEDIGSRINATGDCYKESFILEWE